MLVLDHDGTAQLHARDQITVVKPACVLPGHTTFALHATLAPAFVIGPCFPT